MSGRSVPSDPIILIQDLTVKFDQKCALDRICLTVLSGDLLVVIGPNDAGKSTLLHVIGGLLAPSSGTVQVNGVNVGRSDRRKLATYRADVVASIFQHSTLISSLTVEENIRLPLLIGRRTLRRRKDDRLKPPDVESLMKQLHLSDDRHKLPGELAGGKAQRVNIARALVRGPRVILADEPMTSADTEFREQILALLHQQSEDGRTVLITLHDEIAIQHLRSIHPEVRLIRLENGKIESPTGQASLVSYTYGRDDRLPAALPSVHMKGEQQGLTDGKSSAQHNRKGRATASPFSREGRTEDSQASQRGMPEDPRIGPESVPVRSPGDDALRRSRGGDVSGSRNPIEHARELVSSELQDQVNHWLEQCGVDLAQRPRVLVNELLKRPRKQVGSQEPDKLYWRTGLGYLQRLLDKMTEDRVLKGGPANVGVEADTLEVARSWLRALRVRVESDARAPDSSPAVLGKADALIQQALEYLDSACASESDFARREAAVWFDLLCSGLEDQRTSRRTTR